MARDYARIMTAIWDNKEFCHLSEGAQRTYLLLVTQPDISAAGVLRMWVPRWVQMSRTSTEEGVQRCLSELESGRFIVMDLATGELLIRSFIRWDAGFNNPKRRPVIVRAGEEVRSALIARHLEVEFKRCGLLPDPPPTPNGGEPHSNGDSPTNGHAHSLSGVPRVDLGSEPFHQVNSLSAPNAPEDGVVVTYLPTNPTTRTPQPVPPTAGADAPLPGMPAEQSSEPCAGPIVASWAEGYATTGNKPPARMRSQVGREGKELLGAGNDPDRLAEVAYILGCKGRATLAVELGIQSTRTTAVPLQRMSRTDEWQSLKRGTGTHGLSPLQALPGGESA